MSKKDFQPIENDYQFFMDSATESEQDLAEHLRELTRIEASDRPLSILDFGCGEGEFTESLLAAFQREPQQLHLALLEPQSCSWARAGGGCSLSRYPHVTRSAQPWLACRACNNDYSQ